MRKVVDTNCLQSPQLRAFLTGNVGNEVVLSDYAAMEMYKDTPETLYRLMEILKDYPDQILVLRTTGELCGLSGRGSGLQRRIIDQSQTKGFGLYCRQLQKAKAGDHAARAAVASHAQEARAHLAHVLNDVTLMPDAVGALTKIFSATEITGLRTGARLTLPTGKKLVEAVMHIAEAMFKNHPSVRRMPSLIELPNTYIFRMALCAVIWSLDRISVGGVSPKMRADRLRNDMVDLHFAAAATFFDGLISEDHMPRNIYYLVRAALDGILSGIQLST